MATEVDNKQNPAAAPAEETVPAAIKAVSSTEAVAAAAVTETAAAGGEASADATTGKAAAETAAAADTAATEAAAAPAAKPEPPVKYNVHRQNFEKDIVYLYQFSRTPVLPSLSPYCLKVESWLRLAGLKYEVNQECPDMIKTYFLAYDERVCICVHSISTSAILKSLTFGVLVCALSLRFSVFAHA